VLPLFHYQRKEIGVRSHQVRATLRPCVDVRFLAIRRRKPGRVDVRQFSATTPPSSLETGAGRPGAAAPSTMSVTCVPTAGGPRRATGLIKGTGCPSRTNSIRTPGSTSADTCCRDSRARERLHGLAREAPGGCWPTGRRRSIKLSYRLESSSPLAILLHPCPDQARRRDQEDDLRARTASSRGRARPRVLLRQRRHSVVPPPAMPRARHGSTPPARTGELVEPTTGPHLKISDHAVASIWRGHGVRPRAASRSSSPPTPNSKEKVVDVVGALPRPARERDRAVDEKSQIQVGEGD
jgi:hypothetical protein